jgi:hypothetical protein
LRGPNSLAARYLWAYQIGMSIDGAKKTRGRPTVDSEAVKVRIERQMLNAIDAWAAEQDDAPSRPEAVRRLVQRGLQRGGA